MTTMDMWRVQHQALCCECGAQRTTTARGTIHEVDGEPGAHAIVMRKCANCGVVTRHAWLRSDRQRELGPDPVECEPAAAEVPAVKRPFWLTEPCPDWCTRPHNDGDSRNSRVHDGLQRMWTLPDGLVLTGDNRGDDGDAGDPAYIQMCVRQDVRGHGRPNIAVQIGTGGFWGVWELDRALAARVMVRLRELLDVIDPAD